MSYPETVDTSMIQQQIYKYNEKRGNIFSIIRFNIHVFCSTFASTLSLGYDL